MFYSVKDNLNGVYFDELANLTNRTFGTKFDYEYIMAIRAATQNGEIKPGQEHYDMAGIYQSYYKSDIDEINATLKKGEIVDYSSVDDIKDIMQESDEAAQDFQKFNFDKKEEPDFKETKEQANRQAKRQ